MKVKKAEVERFAARKTQLLNELQDVVTAVSRYSNGAINMEVLLRALAATDQATLAGDSRAETTAERLAEFGMSFYTIAMCSERYNLKDGDEVGIEYPHTLILILIDLCVCAFCICFGFHFQLILSDFGSSFAFFH